MGACHSRRDTIPNDSIHVLLGIKDDKELKRRYSQEEYCCALDESCSYTYRPSPLDAYVNTLREEEEEDVKHPRRALNKRWTMETSAWSLNSENVDELHDSIPRSLAYKENATQSCAALVEPTQTPSQCSLAA
jgi:hypothetical protein